MAMTRATFIVTASLIFIGLIILTGVVISEGYHYITGDYIATDTTVSGQVEKLHHILYRLYDKNAGMEEIDSYFSPDTRFVYRGKSITYRTARKNLIAALKEKKVTAFINFHYEGSRDNITLYMVAEVNGKERELDSPPHLKLKRTGIFSWKVIELKSDDKVFGYLFFDRNIELN